MIFAAPFLGAAHAAVLHARRVRSAEGPGLRAMAHDRSYVPLHRPGAVHVRRQIRGLALELAVREELVPVPLDLRPRVVELPGTV
jgi:hypothetical protein